MRAIDVTLDWNSYRTVALGVNVAGNVSRRCSMAVEESIHYELTRRELLKRAGVAGALVAAPGAVLAGAASAASSGTIETWSPDTRPDALKSEKWWDEAFMKANSGAKVKQLTVPYGQDTTKLKAGQATGIVPDIIWGYTDLLYSYGQDGLVAPVNDVIKAVGRKRFLPAALDNIVVGGKVYAVPFVGFPFFIYHLKAAYRKHKLKAPTTHAQ